MSSTTQKLKTERVNDLESKEWEKKKILNIVWNKSYF